ncbi:(2Fe-2S)-binding protein [Poriferisphaera corsica]|uniref:(2Fe-2S)-binding protein n=1 Tax=Poriferisphaera corsica TaxID=2528020 RepID=UPI00119D621D|nr:(2Fe-2S)-binding protein [Poriferisphaera corsica]
MKDDDQVCLCYRVSKRKIVNYCKRERPPVASLISQCLSAGTGCGWCVPYLKHLHKQTLEGNPNPDLSLSPEEYAKNRASYRKNKKRPSSSTSSSDR